ncbi:ATP-binding protein [Gelidibacter sp.]|uniref:AAA family ATPase n=1 Tax=Gelidibacter sp. TaxID=2018083 RepID=UPI002B9545CB|nr:ATP-binding protein [Gelidibacter sp.]HUH29563.1 ATP-binding protein [Gelidibacter sp.]
MAHHSTYLNPKHNVLSLDQLHLNEDIRERINQLLEEFTYINALNNLNIPVDNKILLYGHTGCGKTATAYAIGHALNKKVIAINLSGFVSSKLGETAKNLSELFKKASNDNAILFIDEFDFIGKLRDYDEKDSGEMKRLVNTLLQLIDNLPDTALLICATNHLDIIDTALLRRFQIRLRYTLPTEDDLNAYYDSILAGFPNHLNSIKRSYGISYAEAKDSIHQQIKANVIKFEKQKKHLLFFYDTPELEALQRHYYGRKLIGTEDTLSGFKLKDSKLNGIFLPDKNSAETSRIAIKSKEEGDKLTGMVSEITGEELVLTDRLTPPNSQRILATTNSGTEVWVYVEKNEF